MTLLIHSYQEYKALEDVVAHIKNATYLRCNLAGAWLHGRAGALNIELRLCTKATPKLNRTDHRMSVGDSYAELRCCQAISD